jgi:hypothetical protein
MARKATGQPRLMFPGRAVEQAHSFVTDDVGMPGAVGYAAAMQLQFRQEQIRQRPTLSGERPHGVVKCARQ